MQQQERHVEFTIIGDCLVEGLLGQRDGLRLALDEEEGGSPTPSLPRREGEITIDNGVAALVHLPYGDRHFNGDKRGGIAELLHHAVQQLLAHPLFRRQPHPSVPPDAEDLLFAVENARSHR